MLTNVSFMEGMRAFILLPMLVPKHIRLLHCLI